MFRHVLNKINLVASHLNNNLFNLSTVCVNVCSFIVLLLLLLQYGYTTPIWFVMLCNQYGPPTNYYLLTY